jgi:hypothetical protein
MVRRHTSNKNKFLNLRKQIEEFNVINDETIYINQMGGSDPKPPLIPRYPPLCPQPIYPPPRPQPIYPPIYPPPQVYPPPQGNPPQQYKEDNRLFQNRRL